MQVCILPILIPTLSKVMILPLHCYLHVCLCEWASQLELVVKNSPANAGDKRDVGLIPGLGRPSGEGHGNSPGILPGESRGQMSLAGYSPLGRTESDTTEAT